MELSAYLEFCQPNEDLEIAVCNALKSYRKSRGEYLVSALEEEMGKYAIRPEMKVLLQKCVDLLKREKE